MAATKTTYFFVYAQPFFTDVQRRRRLVGVFTSLTDAKAIYDEHDAMAEDVFLYMVITGPTGRVIEEQQIY
jgi:hypothetical protein